MTLENNINFIIKTMQNNGYKINRTWAINYINSKDSNPNLSKEELIKKSFEDTIAFYDECFIDEDSIEELLTQTISIPIGLIEEIKSKGGIERTRYFLEYFYDLNTDIPKDYIYYAKSWKVSKSVAIKWIFEFNKYIEKNKDNSIAI